jgi:4-methyl-5(b-hydroxyethyl)-thiazole monophosphate biosynthesis
MSKAVVFLAPGFEEIETSTIVDVLRRSNLEVTLAGLEPNSIEGGHGMKFVPDKSIDEILVKDYDSAICPGGGVGASNLRKDNRVLSIIKEAFAVGKLVAAICAAPVVLSDAGVLKDKRCTIFPGMEHELIKGGGIPQIDLVVEDGNIITSQGPATALLFALKLAERLAGKEVADTVRERTLMNILLKGVC